MKTIKLFGYKITIYFERQIKTKHSNGGFVKGQPKIHPCNRCSKPATHGNHCENHWIDYSFGY